MRRSIGRLVLAAGTVVVLLAGAATVQGSVTAPRGMALAAAQGASGKGMRRAVVLGLKRPEKALSRFARLVSDPWSPSYGGFLTLGALRREYGASRRVRHRTLRFLRRAPGVGRASVGPTGAVVLATMSQAASRRLFCARGARPPRRGLCIPAGLRGAVRQVVAGELYEPRRTAPAARTARAVQAARSSAGGGGTPQGCKAALESKAFTPNEIATAYGTDGLRAGGLSGSGVRVVTMSPALVDPGPVRAWASCFGVPAPQFRQSVMPGGGPQTSTAPEETYLDVEALAALAPGLTRITAVNVPQDQAFQSSFALFMLGALDPARNGGRLPDVLSISDGTCESDVSRAEIGIGQHLLRAAAALGVTALAASGDVGFLGCEVGSGASWPAASPYVTGVGGTELGLDPQNRIASQVVWSTFAAEGRNGAGSGGGPSSVWRRPGWQVGPGIGPALQPGPPTRLTPDLASMASFTPGLAVLGGYGGWGGSGGTSAATPLTAAILALVLERERAAGRPPLGAVGPLLYALAGGPAYDSIFWDVVEGTGSPRPSSPRGRTPAGGAAQPGYDMATGLGSLKAEAFAEAVAALRGGAGGG